MKVVNQEKVISLIVSGKLPRAKKFAGHHVLVVKDEILPLKEGKEALAQIEKLERKYKKTPTIVFVPRQDISYILLICKK